MSSNQPRILASIIFEAGDAELEPSPMRVEVVTLVDDGRQRES